MRFKRLTILVSLTILTFLTACSTKPKLTTHLADKQLTPGKAGNYLDLARENLTGAVDYIKNRQELTQAAGENHLKSVAQKNILRMNWSRFLDHIALAQQIEEVFADYGSQKYIKQKHRRFLIHYEAFLLSYKNALSFLNHLGSNRALDTILNEKSEMLGFPQDSLAATKQYYLNLEMATRFAAYQVVHAYYSSQSGYELSKNMMDDQNYVWEMGKGKGIVMTVDNGLQILHSWTRKLFFPAQKTISQLMGDIKIKRSRKYLITDQQLHDVKKMFQPGDIFLERREWYLSNIGLPGFWPHMALYTGTKKERSEFFAGHEKVKQWVQSQGIGSGEFETLLKITYPQAYKKSLQIQKDGYFPRIIEAIGKGVSFSSLEYSAGADSLGVLRPKRDKAELARAIFNAFSYYGKPYDFDFDFLTDNKVVCSELIYKAYEPKPPFLGISFPIITMLGRKVSSPNHTVQQFDEAYATDRQQLEFVIFIDGYESEQKAYISNRKAFRNSWKRPKWHIFMQEKGK